MSLYSEKMMNLIKQIGEPLVTKSTSTQTATKAGEPLDISSLLMLLMFSGLFKKPAGQQPAPTAMGATGLPGVGLGGMGAASITPDLLMRLLGGL